MPKILLKINICIIIIILIFGGVFFVSKSATIEEVKSQIKDKEKEIQEIEKKINSYQNLILKAQKQKNTLSNQINLINTEIENLNWSIRLTGTKIKRMDLEIEKLILEIKKQTEDIETKKGFIINLFRLLQNYDDQSFVEIFLKNLSFSNVFNQIQNVESLEKELKKSIDLLKQYRKELNNKKINLELDRLKLIELNKDLAYKKEINNEKKLEKQYLLRKTKNRESLYQKYLKKLKEQREAIQKEIYDLEDKLRYLFDPNSVPKPRSGLLSWPVRGIITQRFGKTSKTGFVNNVYNFHNGVDIAVPIGTKIKAAKEGEVIAMGNLKKYAYGKWLAIKHDNGLITLYGHLSKIIVKVGERVQRKQVIGYSGNTGFSTGPHLHFTVYAANTFRIKKRWYGNLPIGWSLNPMLYL